MKKQIITGIGIVACVALCAAVWPRSTEVENLPIEPLKSAVSAEIEARSEETRQILLSADTPADEAAAATEIELLKTDITAEEKTETLPPMESAPRAVSKSEPTSTEPKPGTIAVIEGVESMWVPGFGWVKDEGGGSICTIVDGEGDINKQVGIMGGGTTVGNPGDELTGHKVGIMGSGDTPANSNPVSGTKKYIDGVLHVWVSDYGYIPFSGTNVGTTAENMYENGNKIGNMGGEECLSSASSTPPAEQPEITGNIIYTELQPPVTKNSIPPAYKPNGETYNP